MRYFSAKFHLKSSILILASLLLLAAPSLATTQDADTKIEAMIDNSMTELSVKASLLEKFGTDMLWVDVEADGDYVTLHGKTENASSRQLAKEVALSVEGVNRVSNHLKLEKKSTETPVATNVAKAELEVKDALLESRVKTKLLSEMGLNALDIEVEAVQGQVSLRGTLESPDHEKLALKTAEDMKGVAEVVDLLSIESAS